MFYFYEFCLMNFMLISSNYYVEHIILVCFLFYIHTINKHNEKADLNINFNSNILSGIQLIVVSVVKGIFSMLCFKIKDTTDTQYPLASCCFQNYQQTYIFYCCLCRFLYDRFEHKPFLRNQQKLWDLEKVNQDKQTTSSLKKSVKS